MDHLVDLFGIRFHLLVDRLADRPAPDNFLELGVDQIDHEGAAAEVVRVDGLDARMELPVVLVAQIPQRMLIDQHVRHDP